LALFAKVAKPFGYRAIGIGLNPFKTEFKPSPPLNDWEVAHRSTPEEQTAYIHMLTYGPDVSLSHPGLSTEQVIDAARKLTFYSPYVVPFSFSSPFYEGRLWGGLSRRTYYRTGDRPAALAFIKDKADLVESRPSLTEEARLPAEVGRIEFKAFDSAPSIKLYGSLLALVKGIILDTSLTGRATTPDKAQHQLSAQKGFGDDTIYQQAQTILAAARSALPESDRNWLLPLEKMLTTRRTPADTMIEQYHADSDIITLLETNNAATL
jgi:gamma-glutamyl:cysteine ligase YbdK (ATP-grasp superfamily)